MSPQCIPPTVHASAATEEAHLADVLAFAELLKPLGRLAVPSVLAISLNRAQVGEVQVLSGTRHGHIHQPHLLAEASLLELAQLHISSRMSRLICIYRIWNLVCGFLMIFVSTRGCMLGVTARLMSRSWLQLRSSDGSACGRLPTGPPFQDCPLLESRARPEHTVEVTAAESGAASCLSTGWRSGRAVAQAGKGSSNGCTLSTCWPSKAPSMAACNLAANASPTTGVHQGPAARPQPLAAPWDDSAGRHQTCTSRGLCMHSVHCCGFHEQPPHTPPGPCARVQAAGRRCACLPSAGLAGRGCQWGDVAAATSSPAARRAWAGGPACSARRRQRPTPGPWPGGWCSAPPCPPGAPLGPPAPQLA